MPGADRPGRRDPAEIRYVTGGAVTEADPTGAGPLYDARRGVYYAKPLLRGWLHLLCFLASLAGGTLLLARAHGAAQVAAAAVYSASLAALFGTSALYHRGTWSAAWRLRLRHLDQTMIFFLIAGTATPAFLLCAPAGAGLPCLIVMWALTLSAVAVRVAWASAPELVAGAVFIGLGCAGGLALPWVWIHAGTLSGALLLAGGVLYIAGALSYHHRWPQLYPSVFGYHEAFHVYVCLAAACQYAAIALFVG
ncbi:MAG: hemolysin III family protein [Trebonia sp.]|jgi:hemolysin III